MYEELRDLYIASSNAGSRLKSAYLAHSGDTAYALLDSPTDQPIQGNLVNMTMWVTDITTYIATCKRYIDLLPYLRRFTHVTDLDAVQAMLDAFQTKYIYNRFI